MAPPDQTIPDPAGLLGDLGRVHATLRSLAVNAHRATRIDRAEPQELHALSRQIHQYRRVVRDHLGEDLRRWLENLQRRVEAIHSPAPSRAEDPCGSNLPVPQPVT